MKYAIKNYDEKTMAKARVNDVGVSLKVAIEITNMIRNKDLSTAKVMLQQVIEQKKAVPYKRFNKDVGHKRAIGPGRYPINASKIILSLLDLAGANAVNKGLDSELQIVHLVANKGSDQWHYGRQRRRKMKRSHIEIVVKEKEGKAKKAETKSREKPVPKQDVKKEDNQPKHESKSKKTEDKE